MDANLPKPRRWFRFSLRTMFVLVTVLCIWLGYYLNWIRQRHDYIERYGTTNSWVLSDVPTHFPWPLRALGEQEVLAVNVPPSQSKYVRKLFPEIGFGGFLGCNELDAKHNNDP
jgi:hypothetical protein